MHWIALQPLPEVSAEHDSAPALVDRLGALGWWALQFTPKVAQVEQVLVMELSASERLLGGRKQLLRTLFIENRPLALVSYARAATSLIAIARLQLPASAPRQPDQLPLGTLLAAQPHLPTLARLGCTTWGQLRMLPRGGVARRFGAGLLDALDRAYGNKPELYRWLALPEVFFARLELSARIDNAPALMFGARRLLAQLQLWLQARQHGILALALGWELDARRQDAAQGQLIVRTAEPTLDMSHLQRLLAEQLARVTLHAPALSLHLRSLETAALPGASASLLPGDVRRGDSLQQLLERLSARLGANQVLRAVPCADHRPERMQVWQAAAPAASVFATDPIAVNAYTTRARGQNSASRQQKTDAQSDALYPTWLLTQALKLPVRNNTPQCAEGGPLTLLAGPQRLEAGWWGRHEKDGACALRDYFVARSEQMGLLWIYRQRLAGPRSAGRKAESAADADSVWYLHGLFA